MKARILLGIVLALVVTFLVTTMAPNGHAQDASALRFDIIVKAQVKAGPPKIYAPMWTAGYTRTLPSGALWLDGDRDGYKGAYGFLSDEAKNVGRFVFAAGYVGGQVTQITDRYMAEGKRLYDGTLVNGGNEELDDMPVFPSFGPRQRPNEEPSITFLDPDGNVLEVRDYELLSVSPQTTFNLLQVIDEPFFDQGVRAGSRLHTVYQRVVVGSYYNGKEAANIYYDILAEDYSVVVTLNGEIVEEWGAPAEFQPVGLAEARFSVALGHGIRGFPRAA